jgi:methylenetetrahydrofolate reductase (NADPH)
MKNNGSKLQEHIRSGKSMLLAEIKPPKSADPDVVRKIVKKFSSHVNALGISDNRDEVSMSALAAAAIAVSEGMEPILHMVTRDRNRIGLISDCLGAYALGIRNLLCTGGGHQSLGRFKTAKNVYDMDPVQLMQSVNTMTSSADEIGEDNIKDAGKFCLGGVANPFADPVEMQNLLLGKKISAGAEFFITQPVFDFDRFGAWWKKITETGMDKKAAFIPGIIILTDAAKAKEYAGERPSPMIPDKLLKRLSSKQGKDNQREEGMKIASEILEQLSSLKGLRGFEISCDDDNEAVLDLVRKTGLKNA